MKTGQVIYVDNDGFYGKLVDDTNDNNDPTVIAYRKLDEECSHKIIELNATIMMAMAMYGVGNGVEYF